MKSFAQLAGRQLSDVSQPRRFAFRRGTIPAIRSCALRLWRVIFSEDKRAAISHVRKFSPLPALGAEEADQNAVPRGPDREADVSLFRRRYGARLRVKE